MWMIPWIRPGPLIPAFLPQISSTWNICAIYRLFLESALNSMPFPFELYGAPLFLSGLSQRLMNMMGEDEGLHGHQGVNPVRNSSPAIAGLETLRGRSPSGAEPERGKPRRNYSEISSRYRGT